MSPRPGEVEYVVTAQFAVRAVSAEEAVNFVRDSIVTADDEVADLIENKIISGTVAESQTFGLEDRVRKLRNRPKAIIHITAAIRRYEDNPRRVRGLRKGTKRPYRLGFSDNGIMFDSWGAYSTPERAWAAQAGLNLKGFHHLYNGYWTVTGPDNFTEYLGVGRSAGTPLPFHPEAKEKKR